MDLIISIISNLVEGEIWQTKEVKTELEEIALGNVEGRATDTCKVSVPA